MSNDPFGALPATDTKTAPAKKAAATKTSKPVEDAVPTATEAAPADLLDLSSFIAEMVIGEEEFEQPEEVVFARYIKPADGTWIVLEITDAKVELRENQKAVVCHTQDGQRVLNPKAIDVLVAEHGAEEEVVHDAAYYQFRLEAQHVVDHFGERQSPYLMFAPVFDMRVPFNKPRKGNKRGGSELGFDKKSGRLLLAATRVVKPGVKVKEDEAQLQELAESMVGKMVMARVRRRESDFEEHVPRKYDNGSFVKALADEDSALVRVAKSESGFTYKKTGEAYEGDTSALIPFDGDFVIPDSGENALIVKDTIKNTRVFDNLHDDVAPVPSQEVEVQRTDGSEVSGKITLETVGFVTTRPVKAGTPIQVVLEGGELVTATWLGTHWEETGKPHEKQVTEAGEVRIVPVSAGQEAASAGGLDVFKGDD